MALSLSTPFPPQLEPFLVSAVTELPVPVSDRQWPAFALLEESVLREMPTVARDSEFAVGCLESLRGIGASVLAVFLLEFAYRRASGVGQANDLLQRLARPLIDTLATELSLLDYVSISPDFRDDVETKEPIRRRVERDGVNRLLGALAIGGDYSYAKTLFERAMPSVEASSTTLASYKTALQETLDRARQGPPAYSLLQREGPAHDPNFFVAVTTPDGRSAEGSGPSKKKAEEQAAKRYLSTYWHRQLHALERISRSTGDGRPWPDARLRHTGTAFVALAGDFRIPEDALPLLSLALTHKGSAPNARQAEQWQSLAQLGAAALDTIAHRLVLEEGISEGHWSSSPEVALTLARNGMSSTDAFEALHFDRVFIADELARTDKVKSDAFQAVVAVALLAHGEAAPELLPSAIQKRLRALVRRGVTSGPLEIHDPKTRLNQVLASMRVEAVYSVARTEGRPHDRTFYSRLALNSRVTGQKIVVNGGSGSSRAEADKQLAGQVGRLLSIANAGSGARLKELAGNQRARELAKFFLEAEIATVKSGEELTVARLAAIDALGASLLRTADDFVAWVEGAEQVMGQPIDAGDQDLLGYFRHLGAVARVGTAAAHTQDIADVISFVRDLDPESYVGDLRDREGFGSLLALASLTRLLTHPVAARPVNEIAEEVELLHRSHKPGVVFERPLPACFVTAREGALQTLVEEIVKALDIDDIRIRVELGSDGGVSFTYIMGSGVSGPSTDLLKNPLWRFFSSEFPNLQLETSGDGLRVLFDVQEIPSNPFAEAALRAYRGSTAVDAAESEALAHLLHDLKNRLVAFHLALAQPHDDRTARLAARLDASQHLDACLLLCDGISTIRSALAAPEIERLDVGRFFREYFAEKYATLPSTVEIQAPSRADGMELMTSRPYLRSILDNLVKNAVEAMPEGGQIRCDWVADEEDGRLLVEISDTGCGMETEEVDSLLQGRGMRSSKDEGTGVGMMTVVAMVGRLGGLISGESALGSGTRWIIELPSINDDETRIGEPN